MSTKKTKIKPITTEEFIEANFPTYLQELPENAITVSDIVSKTKLNKSTVIHRLNALVQEGKLTKHRTLLNSRLSWAYIPVEDNTNTDAENTKDRK